MCSSLDALSSNHNKDKFYNLGRCCLGEQMFNLLLRKGIHSYKYIDSIKKFHEVDIPPKDEFYSTLNDTEIPWLPKYYEHARNIWEVLNCRTIGNYHQHYNKTNDLLLADVFESFRNVYIDNYKLDPVWYYISPGLEFTQQ